MEICQRLLELDGDKELKEKVLELQAAIHYEKNEFLQAMTSLREKEDSDF